MERLLVCAGRYALGTLGCMFLVLFGWFSPKTRETLHEVAFRLGLRKRPEQDAVLPPTLIPQITLGALCPHAPPVRVIEPDAVSGNISELEMLVVASLIASRQPQACFEIGTFDGRTTLNLAANAGSSCRIYTLDLPPGDLGKTALEVAYGDENFIVKDASGARFSDTPWSAQITQLYGDSAAFDFTPYEGMMDMVFVDGAHSAAYVKSDTEVALRLLKPEGGLILWHDYSSYYWRELTVAMNELYAGRSEFRSMRWGKGTTLVVWEKKPGVQSGA